MPEESLWATFFTPEEVLHKLGLPTVGDVVDFGCGYGTFTIPAAKITSGTVYALDIDLEMVAITKQKAEAAGLENVRTYVRDFVADGTGLPDASVQYVMLFNILHAERPEVLLREAYRVLAPGGKLGIIHWNYDSDQGNPFTENTFMNNNQQVARDGDGALERVGFSFQNRGNYWSDYKGYPGSDPAIGALPYRVQNLFDSLADQYPNLQLFRFSPAQEAIGLAAEAFPLIQPEVVLTDDHPLMEPPVIQATSLPAEKSGGLWAFHWHSWPAWPSWSAVRK